MSSRIPQFRQIHTSPMRIAYLNVWSSISAETQAGEVLKIVGKRIGAEVIPCINNSEVDACQPDFVLVISRTQAKLSRYRTYLCVNEPSTVYFRDPKLLQYFYTFDEYLTLSDSLERFTQQALYGIGRSEDIGAYYNTAQKYDGDSACVRDNLKSGNAKLAYFGTNWDGRRMDFFRELGNWEHAELYGPESSWEQYKLPAYKGSVAYDGVSVQNVYRKKGIGLNILGDHHLQEDVISNRVFEIASVGAVVMTCRMPWLEKHFGDSLYYFEQESSNKRLLEQVKNLYAHILANPDKAFEKAQRARKIFEEKFCLEVLIKGVIAKHKKRDEILSARSRQQDKLISVIIKSDGSDPEKLKRAVESVVKQEVGRFQIILVQAKPFMFALPRAPHVTLDTIKGTSLWDGFPSIKGEHFALLREEDEWFPQHAERMLEMIEPDHFVHCALVTEHQTPATEQNWIKNNERRAVTHQLDLKGQEFRTALDLIPVSGFLAPVSILDARMRENPNLQCGEEKALLMDILARAKPKQSFATTVFTRKAEERAKEAISALDNTLLMLRHWRSDPHTGAVNNLWDTMVDTGHRARAYRYETQRTEENGVVVDKLKICRFDRARLQPMPMPWIKSKSFFQLGMQLENEEHFTIAIQSNEQMRGIGAFIALQQHLDEAIPSEFMIVVEAEIEAGQIGVHLLQNERTLERYNVARSFAAPRSYSLEIPIYYRPEINGIAFETAPNTKGRIKAVRAYREE